MKKSKRLFAILLALAMIVTFMPAMAFAEAGADKVGTKDSKVTINLKVEKKSLLVNEQIIFSAEASDADYLLIYPDSENNPEWQDWRDGRRVTSRDYWQSYGDEGTYVFLVKAYRSVEGDDPDEELASASETITVTKKGDVGDFGITKVITKDGETVAPATHEEAEEAPFSVTRTDSLTLEFTSATDADIYGIYAWKKEGEDYEEYNFDSPIVEKGATSITLNTVVLEPGQYWVGMWANGLGYRDNGSSNEIRVDVTDKSVDPGDMYFEVSKNNLKTCEEFEFSAYCPGADWIEVYPDAKNDEWCLNSEGRDYLAESESYGDSGEYTLVAYAFVEGDDDPIAKASETMTVTASKGELDLKVPPLPSYLTAGKDGLSFTVDMPVGARNMRTEVRIEDEYDPLFEEDIDEGSISVKVPANEFSEDMTVIVQVEAWGPDYEGTRREFRIPVIGAASSAVSMTASKTDVLVNEDIQFIVTAGGKKIDELQFFNGWNLEYADEFDFSDDRTMYERWHSLDESGKYAIYAKVKLEGSNKWLTTAPIQINATSKGKVGNFDITGTKVNGTATTVDPIVVKQGDILTVTYTEATNADRYWIDVLQCKGEDWWDHVGHYADSEQLSTSLGTAELEPGDYLVQVKATGLGYEGSQQELNLIVEPNTTPRLSLEVSSLTPLTNEEMVISAYCPDAARIEVSLFDRDADDPWWEEGREGNGYVGSVSQPHEADSDLVVKAYDENDELIDSKEKQIKFIAPNGDLDMQMPDLPEEICIGGYSFTVTKPDEASEVFVDVGIDSEPWDESNVIFREGTRTKSLKVTIPANKIKKGMKLYAVIGGDGVGYNEVIKVYNITVVDHKWDSGTVVKGATEEATGLKTFTCSICGEKKNETIPKIVLPCDLKKVSLSKPMTAKKKVTVKWKKVKKPKAIQGIEIQVATDSGFRNIVKSTTAGKKKTSKKIGGLKPKTKYYVRVRAYKTVSGVKHVSAWTYKTAKTKKK